jgi:hypothetical protein
MTGEETLNKYVMSDAMRDLCKFRDFSQAELTVIEEVLGDVEYYQDAKKQTTRDKLLKLVREQVQKNEHMRKSFRGKLNKKP